jgi:hypothetical protein
MAALRWCDTLCLHPEHVAVINPANASSIKRARAMGSGAGRPFDYRGRETLLLTRLRGAQF